MKRVIVGAATAAVLVSGLATPAAAKSRGCVTAGEFAKARKGWNPASVARLFDTIGEREIEAVAYGVRMEVRRYPSCRGFHFVSVRFRNDRLKAKELLEIRR